MRGEERAGKEGERAGEERAGKEGERGGGGEGWAFSNDHTTHAHPILFFPRR